MRRLKPTLLVAIGLFASSSLLTAAYPVVDVRANMLLNQILRVEQQQLSRTGSILGVNQNELAVLEQILSRLGSPAEAQSILTGESQSVGSSTSNAFSSTEEGGLSNYGNSSIGNIISTAVGGDLPETLRLNYSLNDIGGSLGNLEGLMQSIPGYQDFDMGSVFKGLGHIKTFVEGDYTEFTSTIGDPSGRLATEVKNQIFGIVDSTGMLKSAELDFGRRLMSMDSKDFSANKFNILGDVSKIFMSRVLENVNESAARNEVLAKETQAAYQSAATATTMSEQMSAQNRINADNNMIELEKLRVSTETSAAQVSMQGAEVDILEKQEKDRNLENFLSK